MATEHQTLEVIASDTDDASQPLRRGQNILRMLQHAARATRLETQVMELESALKEANSGDPRTLQQWLDNYDQNADHTFTGAQCLPHAPATEPLRINTASRPMATSEMVAGEYGWAAYSTHSRRRLDAIQLQWGDAQPWLVDADVPDADASDADVPDAKFDGAVVSTWLLDDDLREAAPEELIEESPDALSEALPEECVADLGDLRRGDGSLATQAQPLSQRVFGSYGLSILGHALVLIVLGTITYRAPADGNSLGSQVLQAAESSSEVELSSEVEMFEPAQSPLSETMSEPVTPSTTIASELAQLSQSAATTTVEVPLANNVGSTIASAISAATSTAAGGSRSSGAPAMNGNFFGVGTGGNYFCYVVDRSGSMRGGAWDSAKAELMRSLKSLKATQKFYIIFFADEFEALPEPGSDQPATTGLYATPENVDHARRWIQSVELNRGGPPNEALAWAIDREPDAIYLLTDGVTKVDVCGFLRKQNRIEDIVSGPQVRVPIHAIAYFSLDGQQLMRQLAKENQGQFIYVPKPKAKK